MMPDLGKYALWVLSAYGVSLGLLVAMTGLSVWQARRTKRALQAMEAGRRPDRAEGRPNAPAKAGAGEVTGG